MSLLNGMDAYVREMVKRDRTVVVYEDSIPIAWCTFFILSSREDIPIFYHRRMWDIPLDFPQGEVIYIDKIICPRKWVPAIRRQVQTTICGVYPQLKWMAWYRPTITDDRLIIRPIRRT